MKRQTNHLVQRACAQHNALKRLRIEGSFKPLDTKTHSFQPLNQHALRYYVDQKPKVEDIQSNVTLDFENAYTKIDDYYKLFSSFVYINSCQWVGRIGGRVLDTKNSFITKVAAHFARPTYFQHFCGGESLIECGKTLDELRKYDIEGYLDYSVEGENTEDGLDHATQQFVECAAYSAEKKVPFVQIKITSLVNLKVLEKFSDILLHPKGLENVPENMRLPGDYDGNELRGHYSQEAIVGDLDVFNMDKLNEDEQQLVNKGMERLEAICKECERGNVRLLIDAEQSEFQPAIDHMTLLLMLKYNKKQPLIYNTYQHYLRETLGRVKADYLYLKEHGCAMGVKFVRGAYIVHEAKRAAQESIPYPIHKTIQDTHDAYNASVEYFMNELNSSSNNLALFLGTHNQYTIEKACSMLSKEQISDTNLPNYFYIAQLYGMGDSLTHAVATAGIPVIKCIPYGPVEAVLPYLSRRLIENSDMMSGVSVELSRLSRAINNLKTKKRKQATL
mmetsp:Transcript_2405/g.3498  ORF Transcript_2405/g.3498 Transcript_2405/m.3498 type:complete len:504 (-) Transcript_2405:35-1546(-)